jgi:aspartyl-tRNA(Asn)/glutamyl-tRNA(Gln) amidotransferase subunit A
MRSWLDISALPPERRARVLPYILDWVAPAAGYDGATVFRGYSQMQALREAANAAMDGHQPFDFVLSPVSPMPAFPAHQASPLHDPARPFEHIAFTLPFNMSEQPALAINAGYTAAGLPIGLQIIGRRFDDAGVLALGALWEQLRPAQQPWPFSAA